jgi:phage terminase large subunit-like protein
VIGDTRTPLGAGLKRIGDPTLDAFAEFSPEQMRRLAELDPTLYEKVRMRIDLADREREREEYEDSLIAFMQRAWREIDAADLSVNWHHTVIAEYLEDITAGRLRNVVINVPPRCTKSLLANVIWPAWTWVQPPDRRGPMCGPQVSFLCVSYGATLAEEIAVKMRRLVLGEWYQRMWGDRVKILEDQQSRANFGNAAGGERISSSVEGGLLGRGGDCQILDDVISPSEANSQLERERVMRAISEGLATRVRNPQTSARVMIMQRLHMEDPTNYALETWRPRPVHLMFPMRYEPDRACPQDPRQYDGELLWPAVWDEESVAKTELDMGDYACTPAESPILMADLSLKSISEVAIGDEIVGFSTDFSSLGPQPHGRPTRRKLVKAMVKNVFRYEMRKIIKITLASGAIVRCTEDHQWYRKTKGPTRPIYQKAKVGRRLGRVCASVLPTLNNEDARDAGWLSGFYDGEGSVSYCGKQDVGYRASSTISFYQTSGANLPLCDKLERLLNKFGFEWSIYGRVLAKEHWQPSRAYALTGNGLPMYQRFLHIVQPEKWRDRIIAGAYGAKFIREWDEIISIEPDGEEDVFALETTTGNYVVWGFASSNSAAQFQQSPVPRGGGIISASDWNIWPEFTPKVEDMKILPDGTMFIPLPDSMSRIIVVLDTAMKETETADWNACIAFGVWHRPRRLVKIVGRIDDDNIIDDGEQPRVIMMGGWRRRCKLNDEGMDRDGLPKGLVQRVIAFARRFNADELIIEDASRGLDVKNEIMRQVADMPFQISLFNPKKHGDKVARLHAISSLFSQGLVYAPANCVPVRDRAGNETVEIREFAWVREIFSEVEQVPRGAHDDYADVVSMSLLHLRDNGYLALTREYVAEQTRMRLMSRRSHAVREKYGV